MIPDQDLWVKLGQRSSGSKVKFMFFLFFFGLSCYVFMRLCVCVCVVCLHRRNYLTATSSKIN